MKSEAIEQGIEATVPDATRKKMREIMAIRITNASIKLADWAIDGNGDAIDKFFLNLIGATNKKYAKYVNPENFTDAEKSALQKFEDLSNKDIRIEDDWASYTSAEGNVWAVYKKLNADGKHMSYVASRFTKIIAKSKPFEAGKKQSIRELLQLLKKVWQH